MIDTHCHLADTAFDGDRRDTWLRAIAAGISACITIIDPTVRQDIETASHSFQDIESFFAIGVHPHHARMWTWELLDEGMRLLEQGAGRSRIVAIGEIGLDYHYNHSDPASQRTCFYDQVKSAKERDLPIVIHCREAIEDVWSIVREVQPQQLVIHCCTEQWKDVERFVERGYFLSFTGIATFPTSIHVHETIKQCPLSQLLLETDAPYLAPVPHRGKRNEPAFLREVAVAVARLKNVSMEEVDRVTTENAMGFFALPVT